MPAQRIAHAVFCDDIRTELGEKYSLMGIYSRELVLPVWPPVVLPKLGVVVWLVCDIDDPPSSATVVVLAQPGNVQLFRKTIGLVAGDRPHDGSMKMSYSIRFSISPVKIASLGVIEVVVETELGALRASRLEVTADKAALEALRTRDVPPIP